MGAAVLPAVRILAHVGFRQDQRRDEIGCAFGNRTLQQCDVILALKRLVEVDGFVHRAILCYGTQIARPVRF